MNDWAFAQAFAQETIAIEKRRTAEIMAQVARDKIIADLIVQILAWGANNGKEQEAADLIKLLK